MAFNVEYFIKQNVRISYTINPGTECLQMAFGSGINLLQVISSHKLLHKEQTPVIPLSPNPIKGLNTEHLKY
jgi:hypothetical protein